MIRLKRLFLKNFGRHENVELDLFDEGMTCLVGPNGTGKTTILDAIQMLCSNFEGIDVIRFRAMMLPRVRNYVHFLTDKEYLDGSFSVTGDFSYDDHAGTRGEYRVEFTRTKFLSRHPEFIERNMQHYCFSARFDQELRIFQVRRDRWPLFQSLFSAVTGFAIEELDNMFDDSSDTRSRSISENFVLGFKIVKDRETITHRQCSSGEKKIIKCFSTILNKQIQPSIILIDNAVMHVEVGRHLAVIDALEKCFPSSQLVVSCHSIPVQRYMRDRRRLFDMRFLTAPKIVIDEPWRMRFYDEVAEAVVKIRNASHQDQAAKNKAAAEGERLLSVLAGEKRSDGEDLGKSCTAFLASVPQLMLWDFQRTPPVELHSLS